MYMIILSNKPKCAYHIREGEYFFIIVIQKCIPSIYRNCKKSFNSLLYRVVICCKDVVTVGVTLFNRLIILELGGHFETII